MPSPSAPVAVIALDGPAGSGKSTVAKAVARVLGWRYVDTGATYRAATLAVLRAGVDPGDAAAVERAVVAADIRLGTDPDAPAVVLDGDDVSADVRGPEVTAAVSAVAAVPAVRELMVALQREVIGTDGAVAEGRDVGTTVTPGAAVKVYLDASPEVRAARRAGDSHAGVAAGSGDLVATVAADLARRDAYDSSRTTSPLQAAGDAVQLDSSGLGIEQVVAQVLQLASAAGLPVR